MSVVSCQDNSLPQGEIRVEKQQSSPVQRRSATSKRRCAAASEQGGVASALEVASLTFSVQGREWQGMCLKIWGKSGIIQAGAEEQKRRVPTQQDLMVRICLNGLEIRGKEYSGALLLHIAFALIQCDSLQLLFYSGVDKKAQIHLAES